MEAFGEESVKEVSPHLENSKVEVRLTVVHGLGIFGGQLGYDLLQAHEAKERNPKVLSQLRNYIQ